MSNINQVPEQLSVKDLDERRRWLGIWARNGIDQRDEALKGEIERFLATVEARDKEIYLLQNALEDILHMEPISRGLDPVAYMRQVDEIALKAFAKLKAMASPDA